MSNRAPAQLCMMDGRGSAPTIITTALSFGCLDSSSPHNHSDYRHGWTTVSLVILHRRICICMHLPVSI